MAKSGSVYNPERTPCSYSSRGQLEGAPRQPTTTPHPSTHQFNSPPPPLKVDLYVGKDVVRRGIPNEEACDALIELIKDNGMWKDKEVELAEEEAQQAVAA